ncbi:hypothetical protein RvY_10335 [Ramazzottius varieornatus]|uniref:MI domain-containing protein n=1 Tax=Ramazzottius varieornatus TaxID=947166 RepID=A0A1D1VCE3_RAMVA|nr:hypothetical protein RvY_10335 [Ramazzottius varieornatus]
MGYRASTKTASKVAPGQPKTSSKASAASLLKPARTRKEQRKKNRQLKKVKKVAWYTHKTVEGLTAQPKTDSAKRKRSTGEDGKEIEESRAVRKKKDLEREARAQKKVEQLKEKKRQQNIQRLQAENEEEDRLIKKLEKKLRLNKRKNKTAVPASFTDDGLGYLLELMTDSAAGALNVNSEDNWGKKGTRDEDGRMEEELEDAEGEFGSEGDEMEQDEAEEGFDEVPNEDKDDEDQPEEDEMDGEDGLQSEPEESGSLREDIYGRMRDIEGNIVEPEVTGRYIPPARQATDGVADQSMVQLKRQLKGLLNRLTEANMAGIVKQVEQMFSSHSRFGMNETLTSLIFESCISPSLMPKKLAFEYGMFMALLYQNVGVEIGAFYIQKLLNSYDTLRAKETLHDEDRRIDNIVLLWCHAYNFKIIDASMVLDLLGEFADRFREKDINLTLSILREVGFSLRKDDPVALKELVATIQSKIGEKRNDEAKEMGSRVVFMLDTISAIKNNNMRKIPNYDPAELEHLLKVFRALIHKGHVMEAQLKVPLTDLRNASEKGRWWVVGAAWNKPGQGDPVDNRVEADRKSRVGQEGSLSAKFSEKLLRLATQQRMNTDVRKAIFCSIMSAEDYNDAFERVTKLGLKNAQEAEIIHVLLHCGLHEKKFNPFYSFVLEKFAAVHRTYQRQFLFTVWDKIRDLSTLSPTEAANLAEMVSHGLLHNDALPITVLKKINFADMNAALLTFLRAVLSELLLSPSEEDVRRIFAALSEKKYKTFRESVRLFVRHFLMRNSSKVLTGKFAKFTKEFLVDRIDAAEKSLLGARKI